MSLIEVALPPEALAGDWGSLPPEAAMQVSAPGMPPLHVQLSPAVHSPMQYRTVTVWEWTGSAADEGDDAAAWFSQFLNTPCRLVRYLGSSCPPGPSSPPGPTVRTTDPQYAAGYETRFSDGYPCLLATEAALQDLGQRLGSPLPMNRFRPNIVVVGAEPWEEDSWGRCSLTRSNPAAGAR